MTGEMLKSLLLEKSAIPRVLKGVYMFQFKLKYTSNAKGWMISAVFTEYCKELKVDLIKQKRKIMMVLDNFSGYRINNLSNIGFVFLSPNTNSILQLLDQGNNLYVQKEIS